MSVIKSGKRQVDEKVFQTVLNDIKGKITLQHPPVKQLLYICMCIYYSRAACSLLSVLTCHRELSAQTGLLNAL